MQKSKIQSNFKFLLFSVVNKIGIKKSDSLGLPNLGSPLTESFFGSSYSLTCLSEVNFKIYAADSCNKERKKELLKLF